MDAALQVSIQHEDFDTGALQRTLLSADASEGAVATFTGYVRCVDEDSSAYTLTLEHYPGMTERAIVAILEESARRWPVRRASVVHRIGELGAGAQIVWVGVSAGHREAAFAACEFIMDYLKTRAPFWKKETGAKGSRWIEAKDSDARRARRWQQNQQQQ